MKRAPLNKARSARKFRKNASRTHRFNVQPPPMRGGWRL